MDETKSRSYQFRQNLSFVQVVPDFLKGMMKDEPTAETKKQAAMFDKDDHQSDQEDEDPQIVVLSEKHLSKEEAETLRKLGAKGFILIFFIF